ncbi:MAG TPA: copper-binding protein [Methylomirabilota bacterium]|nr:copper-binding protein [Methylomirabilota bacterium]
MVLRRSLNSLLAISTVVMTGCAYELAPLPAGHPAHPDAQAAPRAAPSQTLAYTGADVPALPPVTAVAAVPPGAPAPGPPSSSVSESSPRTVVGQGEVVSTVPSSGQIVVDHEEIKGFMSAMTMGYRVDPPSLLASLKEGDRIRFTIDVNRRAIVHIEKMP